jgi:hypothetical protein
VRIPTGPTVPTIPRRQPGSSARRDRETAREFIIEMGARYYRETLDRYGVDTFSDLAETALAEIAAESANA